MNRIMRLLGIVLALSILLSGCTLITKKTTTTITEEETDVTETSTPSSEPSSSSKKPSSSSKKPHTSSKPQSVTSSGIVISIPEDEETNESLVNPEEGTPSNELFQKGEAYKALTDTQKKVYAAIRAMVAHHTEGMTAVPAEEITDISVAYKAVNLDNPQYFWMPHAYIISQKSSGQYYMAIKYESDEYSLDYLYSKEESEKKMNEIIKVCEKLKASIKTEDPYEIELAIHDYLCNNISYPADFNNNNYYNIYGALVEGKAVCEGYARSMQYLCTLMNIPCILVTGVSHNEGHMWNQVQLGGKWYNVDATWDDPTSADGAPWHSYFNVDDEVISLDHSFDPLMTSLTEQEINDGQIEFNLLRMKCDSKDANYAVKNNLLITDNAEFNDVSATNAFLEAFGSGKDHIDLYFAANINTAQYKIDEMFAAFGFDVAFSKANHTFLVKNGRSFMKTSVSKSGRGYRIFFEPLGF